MLWIPFSGPPIPFISKFLVLPSKFSKGILLQISLQLLTEGHWAAEGLFGFLIHLLRVTKTANKLQAKVLPNSVHSDGCNLTPNKLSVFYGLVDVIQFNAVQSLSRVRLFATPWTTARQASLSVTNSRSLRKLMSIASVMPSNHLILCHPLLLPPSIFPRIRVFSNESTLRIRWPKDWSFSFKISPSNEYSGLISFQML